MGRMVVSCVFSGVECRPAELVPACLERVRRATAPTPVPAVPAPPCPGRPRGHVAARPRLLPHAQVCCLLKRAPSILPSAPDIGAASRRSHRDGAHLTSGRRCTGCADPGPRGNGRLPRGFCSIGQWPRRPLALGRSRSRAASASSFAPPCLCRRQPGNGTLDSPLPAFVACPPSAPCPCSLLPLLSASRPFCHTHSCRTDHSSRLPVAPESVQQLAGTSCNALARRGGDGSIEGGATGCAGACISLTQSVVHLAP